MPNNLIRSLMLATGLVGVVLCAVAALVRLGGAYTVAGIGAQAVMVGGIALLVVALFGKSFFVDD